MSTDYEIYFTGQIKDGKLVGVPKKKLSSELTIFEGKHVELIIRRKRKRRTNPQNKLYWLHMNIIAEHLGYTKDEVHAICGGLFLTCEAVNKDTGVVYKYVRSTSALTTVEFMEYQDQYIKWAAEEFSIQLPMPDDQMELV